MKTKQNTIYKEMVLDLCYRLRLADDIFCQVTDTILSAISMEDFSGKVQAATQIHTYSQVLQIIYADYLHIKDGHNLTFPPDISVWQWNEPDGEERITQTVERLHAIADGMELTLNSELLKMEVKK